MAGLHFEQFANAWRTAVMYGVQGGIDVVRVGAHRVGIGLRLETTTNSDAGYTAIGIGLVYRQ